MLNRITVALAFLLLMLACSPAWAMDRVVVVSDMWMPYNGKPNSSEEGYAVDILRTILEPQGYTVAYLERPWKRAVEDVRLGNADMVIGAFKFEMPSFVFPETTIGETTMGMYSNDANWKFQGLQSLKGIRTGLVQGWGYRKWVLAELKRNPNEFHVLHGDDAFPRLVKMLEEGRIQAIPSNSYSMDYYIKANNLEGKIHFAGYGPNAEAEPLYYGMSPANKKRSEKLARLIDKGVRSMRKSGELAKILANYGLKDWQ